MVVRPDNHRNTCSDTDWCQPAEGYVCGGVAVCVIFPQTPESWDFSADTFFSSSGNICNSCGHIFASSANEHVFMPIRVF